MASSCPPSWAASEDRPPGAAGSAALWQGGAGSSPAGGTMGGEPPAQPHLISPLALPGVNYARHPVAGITASHQLPQLGPVRLRPAASPQETAASGDGPTEQETVESPRVIGRYLARQLPSLPGQSGGKHPARRGPWMISFLPRLWANHGRGNLWHPSWRGRDACPAMVPLQVDHRGQRRGGETSMTIIKPQPKQVEFLRSPADIVIY